jgi:zinc protease
VTTDAIAQPGAGEGDDIVIAERPTPGVPRPYHFPEFEQIGLDNGLAVIGVDLPGRELVSASLLITAGAADEPDDAAGVTTLMARGLSEGTRGHDAIELVEASERLGASLHAEAGWDALSVGVDVPVNRLDAALGLVAEMLAEPTFPAHEIERLRDERLNDLLQARADPRRRAEEAFVDTIYGPRSPYRRPAGGLKATVERLDAAACAGILGRSFDPARMTLVVGGDLTGLDVVGLARARFGTWSATSAATPAGEIDATSALDGLDERLVRIIHRPGSVQTEIRIGHVGLPRRIDDFHALSVMSAILGGLFDSRLNRRLREEKGYTYGASAGFDLRRAAGPFAARAAVNTEVTVPAVLDTLAELDGMSSRDVTDAELTAARDFLVGVFPLRFETPPAVVGAIAGLVVQGLPFDELNRYRPAIEAVTGEDVRTAARAHVRAGTAAIVLVGDADAFLPALEAERLGRIVVERDPEPATA